jgi:hypothetical protein
MPRTSGSPTWELSPAPDGALRRHFYRARHILGAKRLERHRLERFDDVPGTYDDLRLVLDGLHA